MDLLPEHEQDQSSLSIDPPPFDPLEPSLPVSFPIKDLEYLESRSYFNSFHYSFNISSVPLPSSSSNLPDRPRILVCHDMAGGYIDDKWIQGGTNSEAYSIWHWYLMDVFVYFSHDLVTIPPPCWTNAAHTHGVKVLGTFITEWDEGRLICNQLLATKASAQMYAERLTELAVALGFDGWLINIEVQLDVGQIANMKEFVSHLTQTMHSSIPGSLVIWYDSVTKDGALKWQDQLNENNKPFFDLCDGIFVNYTWKEHYPKLSATAAGERKFDVYMGIDVFGRNTYGGGQWTTNAALDVLKKDDVSAAIFAPGWVYENVTYLVFVCSWWSLVEKSWGILQHYPKALPFYSNFDQGHGYHFSIDGRQVSKDPWCNISCQSFQPILDNSVDLSDNTIQVLVDFKDASYNGGGSIIAKGVLEGTAYFTTKLFQGELPLENLPIHITYSVRSDGRSLVGLSLVFSCNTNERTSVLLASSGETLITMNQFAGKFDKVIMPLRVTKLDAEALRGKGWVIQESSIAMSGYTLTEIHMVCYRSKPELSELRLHQDPTSEGTKLPHASPGYYASLGHVTIKTSEQNLNFPPFTSWVVEGQYISWTKSSSEQSKSLSFKIFWRLRNDHGSLFPKYSIYVSRIVKHAVDGNIEGAKEYLGVARVQAFYVSDLEVPDGVSSLKFIIQVCGIDGACQELDSCPAFLLDVEGGPGGISKTYWGSSPLLKAKSFANKTVFQIQKWGGECWIWTSILKGLEVMKSW
ncbi:Glycoside hydrolase [Macleaya cordata]|uniref:mannosyl-glycoprotein endo-beta-N-acetylglucosaminidase n=1 Tax=Macleaya cordata TaxID=56857 RepID=A0A200PX64_MACCD|nr:Glycoside hydrolase [Macleaya cordata]